MKDQNRPIPADAEHLGREDLLFDIIHGMQQRTDHSALQMILCKIGTYLNAERVFFLRKESETTVLKSWWCGEKIAEPSLDDEGLNEKIHRIRLALDGKEERAAKFWFRDARGITYIFPLKKNQKDHGALIAENCAGEKLKKKTACQFIDQILDILIKNLEQTEKSSSGFFPAYKTCDFDSLTMLPARYSFEECMERTLLEAKLYAKSGHVVFIDIDDFRFVNRGYGYRVGDLLILELSRFLKSHFEPYGSLFRMNMDSFVFVSRGEDFERMEDVIRSLITRCRSPWKIGGHSMYCTVSIAATRYPQDGRNIEEIYRNLNSAMFQAKETGKNNYVLYQEQFVDISDVILQHREIEKILRNSINKDFAGFELYYQPIYCTKDEMVIGAEALVRFRNSDGTLIAPEHFIPLAENTGLILPIGEFVLENAARFCKSVNDAGYEDFGIHINVSVRQLQQPDFAGRTLETLNGVGVSLGNITLEITEGMATSNIERIRNACLKLREKNVKLALDDLGTGYSSLNMLRTMPVDIIKIDRSFVKDVITDTYSHLFMSLITKLGHSMGMQVCAEGVESAEQWMSCKSMGIDCVQGYYYQKALPEEEFRKLLGIQKADESLIII